MTLNQGSGSVLVYPYQRDALEHVQKYASKFAREFFGKNGSSLSEKTVQIVETSDGIELHIEVSELSEEKIGILKREMKPYEKIFRNVLHKIAVNVADIPGIATQCHLSEISWISLENHDVVLLSHGEKGSDDIDWIIETLRQWHTQRIDVPMLFFKRTAYFAKMRGEHAAQLAELLDKFGAKVEIDDAHDQCFLHAPFCLIDNALSSLTQWLDAPNPQEILLQTAHFKTLPAKSRRICLWTSSRQIDIGSFENYSADKKISLVCEKIQHALKDDLVANSVFFRKEIILGGKAEQFLIFADLIDHRKKDFGRLVANLVENFLFVQGGRS